MSLLLRCGLIGGALTVLVGVGYWVGGTQAGEASSVLFDAAQVAVPALPPLPTLPAPAVPEPVRPQRAPLVADE